MRLSERMILGSTLIKHVPHAGGGGEGCAIQCAVVANRHDTEDMDWMNGASGRCPVCDSVNSIGGLIVELNDRHLWSIDRIAQWVASVEPVEAAEEKTIAESAPSLVAQGQL